MKGTTQAIILAAVVLLWIMVMTGCASKLGPVKQLENDTHKTHTMSVTQIDLNQDGQIDQQEMQQLQSDTPGVMSTFLAIGMLVIGVTAICAWVTTRQHKPVSSSSEGQDGGTFDNTPKSPAGSKSPKSPEPSELIVEDVSPDRWCHAEQDFLGDSTTPPGGKRRPRQVSGS